LYFKSKQEKTESIINKLPCILAISYISCLASFVLICLVFPVGQAQNQEKGFLPTCFFTSSSAVILCHFFIHVLFLENMNRAWMLFSYCSVKTWK